MWSIKTKKLFFHSYTTVTSSVRHPSKAISFIDAFEKCQPPSIHKIQLPPTTFYTRKASLLLVFISILG